MELLTASNAGVSRQALQQRVAKQQLIRLFTGVYVDAKEYAAADVAGQYRLRAKAFLLTHPKLRAWGLTAAALEGAPVLAGATLHFAGAHGKTHSREQGCVFHEQLPFMPEVAGRTAQIIFECASTSPLADTLPAVNHLLRIVCLKERGKSIAIRKIDEKTSEALLRMPLNGKTERVMIQKACDIRGLDLSEPSFFNTYKSMRTSDFASVAAELIWFDFVRLCIAYQDKRAIRKTLRAGLHFTDLAESAAESLLLARCIELGFASPYLQVNIFDPVGEHFLGRVDGLWPSSAVQRELFQGDGKFGRLLYSKQRGDNDSLIVEFDGSLKYRENYAAVLEKERLRHNAISNLGFRFVRVGWGDLMRPERLRTVFETAGVPKNTCR